jgi:hypothetical protein
MSANLSSEKGARAMKVFWLLLCFLFVSPIANAQTTSNSGAQVEVVKSSWSKERLNWEQDPFGGPNENFHQMQFRARSEKRVSDAKRAGNSAEISKLEKEARTDAAIVEASQQTAPPRYYFIYRASMKNTSAKEIAEIDWDYVFIDAGTGAELDRRQFTSVQKVGPGKTKDMSFMIPTPPTRRISVYALDKKERFGLNEQVVIVRVKYVDGTEWQLQ